MADKRRGGRGGSKAATTASPRPGQGGAGSTPSAGKRARPKGGVGDAGTRPKGMGSPRVPRAPAVAGRSSRTSRTAKPSATTKSKRAGGAASDESDKHSLPREVLLAVFSRLEASDLLMCSQVSRQWSSAASDSRLWAGLYQQKWPNRLPALDPGTQADWKRLYINRVMATRRAAFKKLCSTDPFTRLPDPTAVQKAYDVKFVLRLTERQQSGLGKAPCSDRMCVANAVHDNRIAITTMWFNGLQETNFNGVQRLGVLGSALVARAVAKNGTPRKQAAAAAASRRPPVGKARHLAGKKLAGRKAPRTRGLLDEVACKGASQLSEQDSVTDAVVRAHTCGPFIIALWADAAGSAPTTIAFVVANLHKASLIHRLLASTPTRCASLPTQAESHGDDVDPRLGLHDYTFVVCLRTLDDERVLEHFPRIDLQHVTTVKKKRYFSVVLVEATQHMFFSGALELPYACGALSGRLPALIMDLAVLDEHGAGVPALCSSTLLPLSDKAYGGAVDYERDATSSVCSTAHGQHWQAHIEIDRESAERNLLASLTVLVEVDVINSWFGTSL
eukprot:m.231894 g.231894  ORF g.231894 m.231894 type:complete len:561 (+) comp18878_c0_seq10:87-1769(+)